MDNETVNELVVYLAHCNRKDHLATIMEMVRTVAKQEAALKSAYDVIHSMRRESEVDPFSPDFPRKPHYAGR